MGARHRSDGLMIKKASIQWRGRKNFTQKSQFKKSSMSTTTNTSGEPSQKKKKKLSAKETKKSIEAIGKKIEVGSFFFYFQNDRIVSNAKRRRRHATETRKETSQTPTVENIGNR